MFPVASTFAAGTVPRGTTWDDDATRAIADRTWDRHISKIGERGRLLRARPGSAGYSAKVWDTYMASCTPCPAQLCLPDTGGGMRLNACLRRAMGLEGWCPARYIAGIEIVRGVKGGPKCPNTVAKTERGSSRG